MNFLLQSSRRPEECLERLREVSETRRWGNDPFRRDRPPLGMREKGREILLWRRRSYNNSLQPILHLRLEPFEGGTRLTGRFEISSLNFWFLAAWYIVLFYILFFRSPGPDADPGVVFRFALNTGLGIGTPFFVWALGTFLARGDRAFLAEAVRECLKN